MQIKLENSKIWSEKQKQKQKNSTSKGLFFSLCFFET